jgi:phosphorylcholine metabolism protein LicD
MITTNDAFENLKLFKEVAHEVGIPFFLDGGTLLGAYRDNDFCDDDQDDIDLTTNISRWDQVDKLTNSLEKYGFKLYHKWDENDFSPKHTSCQTAYTRNGGKIDLMFKKVKNDKMWWTVFRGKEVIYKCIPFDLVGIPKSITFKGETFSVPEMTHEYLQYRYGDYTKKVHRSKYSCYTTDKCIVGAYEEI